MAHLHCIDHGKRVVVVKLSPPERDPKVIFGYRQAVALHRNGGRGTVRCDSMLKIRDRQYTPTVIMEGLSQIRQGYRVGKPQQTSSR